jgi:hypothetical protein
MSFVSVLTFVGCELVHLDEGTYCWVNIKRFAIGDVDADDRSLLAALIGDRQYCDHYAGQDPAEQDQHDLHGPYWLRAIKPESFQASSREEAEQTIQTWADDPEPQSAHTQARLRGTVYPLLNGKIYRLPDMRDHAAHEWGWVVGSGGFHEFVVINRDHRTVALVVASDD